MRELAIAGRKLGDAHPPFIVAEAGINHNGKLDTALAMVHAAKHARCDAIKFATLKAAEFCNPEHMIEYQYQGRKVVETELEMFQRCELSEEAWHVIKRECDRVGIIFFSTPQNFSDLQVLLRVGVPAIKVGSDDLTNITLIHQYADAADALGIPLILSTGMADFRDILEALAAASAAEVIVLACTSEYPCPLQNANVRRVATLRESLDAYLVGYSDHTQGVVASAAAAALGACYIEKHFTLNNAAMGPDHAFSAGPLELQQWVKAILLASLARGHGHITPTAKERENREKWRRSSGQQIRGEKVIVS